MLYYINDNLNINKLSTEYLIEDISSIQNNIYGLAKDQVHLCEWNINNNSLTIHELSRKYTSLYSTRMDCDFLAMQYSINTDDINKTTILNPLSRKIASEQKMIEKSDRKSNNIINDQLLQNTKREKETFSSKLGFITKAFSDMLESRKNLKVNLGNSYNTKVQNY